MTIFTSRISPAESLGVRKLSSLARREALWGLAFLAPWIIGLLAFILLPMIASLVLSMTNYTITHPESIEFIGLQNYQHMLFEDPAVGESVSVTIRFLILAVPIGILTPLFLAALLNSQNLLASRLFRTLFFMPSLVPFVSAIIIWGGVLNPEYGWVNRFLEGAGIAGPNWLNDVRFIYPAFIIMGMWGIGGPMLIMLASMQGVPTELYDAAKVDGAGAARRFLNVTVPMISPVILYQLTLALIGTFQYFLVPFIIKNGTGQPGTHTLFLNLYLFKTAFTFDQMGYASALAWLLFVLAMSATIILFWTARRWVYYAGGER
ncbi:MAG TPA: sugar ABC transporter permease [Anaerolineae bacterium]